MHTMNTYIHTYILLKSYDVLVHSLHILYIQTMDTCMSGRLKANQLKFDCHMTGMEETMRNIMKDGADVRLMRRGLVRPHTFSSMY